ncbi:hypothetical protein DUI87_22274 [Hirundo rustica rustica]|uniref:Uncharacterized protein n=1 Tax=Hirundo rustica rustica TaxID=333673 RepID=A0A3M0JJS9_HIRRU|nr:hypothetical protein DUI87_22274 [Hirundo rustica rustica]
MTSLLLLATLIQARMPLALLATWAHCWLMFCCWHQHPQVPFLLGTVQPHLPQPITLQGVIVAKVQDSALGLSKPRPIGLCPSVQPFQVFLQSLSSFQQIDTCSQLSVICKFTNERLHTFIHVINKNIEQNWPQHRSMRDTTGDWPQLDAAPFTTTLWAQPSSQFLTQQRVLLSKPRADSLSWSMLWDTVSKALLKSKQTTSTALPASTRILLCTLFVNGCHTGQFPVVQNLTSEPGLMADDESGLASSSASSLITLDGSHLGP